MVKETKEPEISNVIGGTLNILGLKIDLGKLSLHRRMSANNLRNSGRS